jgi:hypothetical protein
MRMPFTTFIYFYLFGLVPIGLINIDNFNLFNTLAIIIYCIYIFYGFKISFINKTYYSEASRYIFLLVIAISVSYLHMIYSLNKYTSWLALDSLNYIIFWVMLKEINSFKDIDIFINRIKIFSVLAVAVFLFLFLNPTLLSGPLLNAGMGTLQSWEFGIPRIFTPSMTYSSIGIVFVLCYLIYVDKKKNIVIYLVFLGFSLIEIGIIAAVRTFVISIILSFCVLIMLNMNIRKLCVIGLVLGMLSVFIIMLGSSGKYQMIFERMGVVFDIKEFNMGVITSGISEPSAVDNLEYGSIYWRILEAQKVLNLIDTPYKATFGNMGDYYEYGGLETTPAPHIGYIGIYYVFGWVGVVAFSLFILYFTKKIYRLMNLYKKHPKEYLAVFLFLAWLNMLIYAVGGMVFYTQQCGILGGICAIAVIMEKLYVEEKGDYYAGKRA